VLREHAGANVMGRFILTMGLGRRPLRPARYLEAHGGLRSVVRSLDRCAGILAASWRGVPPEIHLHRADVSCEHSLREHAGD
jgi:hypothetical protein